MSQVTFSDAELCVLDKGLKFAPSKKLNKFETFVDVHEYIRRLNVQRHFIANPSGPRTTTMREDGVIHSGLPNPSLFNPPGAIAPSIKVF